MLRALLGRLLTPHFHYCGEVVDGERCGRTFDCRGFLCRGSASPSAASACTPD